MARKTKKQTRKKAAKRSSKRKGKKPADDLARLLKKVEPGIYHAIPWPIYKRINAFSYSQVKSMLRSAKHWNYERLNERGIATGIYYPLPVHQQQVYRDLGFTARLPVAETACAEVLSLPVHPALTSEDLVRIVEGVNGR